MFRRHGRRTAAVSALFLVLFFGGEARAATPANGQIRAGTSFALALKSDGTVSAWGLNSNGQLGDGSTTTRTAPISIPGLTNVAGLAAGSAHSLAVLNDGTVRAWGLNTNGRLGDGTTTQRTSPVPVPTLSNVTAVAAGAAFSLALKSDGTVWAWGVNSSGQLGNGTTTQSLVPVQVTGLTSVIAISAGNSFALGLKSDGTVWAWGMNSSGQLGNGSTAQSLVPVQVPGLTAVTAIATGGAHVLALRSDGALRAWGLNTYGRLGDGTTTMRKSPVAVAALTGVTAIGAGASHSLAVKADGTAWGWGLNAAGQLGDGTLIDRTTPTTIPNVADAFAVDADSDFSLILRNDGSIACFGANTNGQFGDGTSTTGYLSPIQSTVWADLLSVTAGTSHSLAIRSDHSLWSWGLNTDGQLGDGTTTTRTSPVAVASLADVSVAAAGATHSLAVLNDGTVRAWGLNTNGQLGDGTTTKSALPVDVSTLTNVTSVAAGTSFSLALKSDGTVWSWGLNTNGQLGNGSTSQSLVPVQVTALTSVIAVTAGTSFSLALKSDGTVWSWGLNTNGQLGNGSTSQSLVPVQIISLTSVAAIAAGSAHALALRSDGTLRAWGLNTNGRLGDGTTTQRATPVTVSGIAGVASIGAGQSHSLAIKSDGTAWAWGLNSSGQLGDGTVTQRTTPTAIPTAIPVRLLRAGGTHTLAVLTDGTLRTWGSNASSQLAAPAFTRSAAALSLTPSDTDTDADGLPDAWELAYFDALLPQSWPDTSGGGIKIIAMISSSNGTGDSDRDGLSDIQEWVRGSDPLLLDADQDRLTDPVDSAPADFFDGVAPLLTIVGGNNQYSPINTFNADPFDIAVWNPAGTVPFVNAPVSFSVITGTGQLSLSNDGSSPLEATVATRTDADGTAQAHFRQPEAAGFISAITVHAGNASLDLTTTSLALQSIDDDDDGLTNAEEVVLGTNPKDPDTDHDNLTDGWEVAAGLSPTTPQSPGIPPHSPTGLSINEQTSSSVTLNWEAVTADPGRVIIGYLVYCNGELVARSQGITHTIACEPEGDFWLYFTVRAVDDTGALSSASAECLVIPRGRAIGSEIRRAAATARRWGIPSPISKRLYRSFSLTLHEEQDDVTWYQDHLHLVNDLAWSVTGHGQAPDGTFSLVGEMNSEGRPDALPHSDWRYSGGDSAFLVGCESASGYVGKIYEIPPVWAAAIGGSDSSFGYSGSGTFDYMVGPHVANRRTWSRVLTCTLADEYTETALLGYIGENYQIAMAMASGLPWNHGASCFQGETSTCGFDDGLPSNYGYREFERNDVQGIMAASIAGTQYRFSCESDVPVHFRWVEQFQSPAGEPPETIGRYEEVALPVGGIASTGTYTSNPPAIPGSVYVYLLDGDISLRPPYSEEKPTRAYLKGAMYVGECIPVGLNTWTNEVTTGIVATFTGDAETVRFYLVDPWILDWVGQEVAIEMGIPVESGTDLWNHPNSPWNGAASAAWQLLAVALNPGKLDFSLKMTMGGMSFTATTPIQVLPRSSLAVDADRDGTIKLASEDDSDATTEDKPFRFWLNDDDDNADTVPDANDTVINGADDLARFYPVFLDIKQLVTVLPPGNGITYRLKQEENALSFVYTNLTRTAAFSYTAGTLTTGFGPTFNQAASAASVQQITSAGLDLFTGSPAFLDAIQNQSGGVLLIEGRQLTDKPLVLSVEKDGTVITELKLELCGMHLGKLWETSNKANQIFNPTKKDDSTGDKFDANGRLFLPEKEGDVTYAIPRNNLYVVADPSDNKLRVSLDLGIPATSRTKCIVAAWDGATKVEGSDTAFSADASQPANLQIAAAAAAETKEYRIKVGLDANANGRLEDSEASPLELYRRKDTGEVRFATIKGISNAKYEEHKTTIVGKIGFLGQSQPGFPAKYARSFLALFYYNGDFGKIATSVRPDPTVAAQQLNAFANGTGFAEWLTHNSGAPFTVEGGATISDYHWSIGSEVSEFLASRTPFALESTMTNAQGYFEFQTATGAALKAFYEAQVKTAAEQALQNSPVGTTLTFPLDGGWYEFPCAASPDLFKTISPGNWVTPSTQCIGTDDGYGGYGALFAEVAAGTEAFKDFDAFGTIGRGRVLTRRYQITVKKEDTGIIFPTIEYKVSEILFECAIEDLYDFNFEDTGRTDLAQRAATIQIGWGKGTNGSARDQGRIYRHRIDIRHTYTYPLDQTVSVTPTP